MEQVFYFLGAIVAVGVLFLVLIGRTRKKHPTSKQIQEHYKSWKYKAARKIALRRDGYQCRLCGSKKTPETHHIRYSNIGNIIKEAGDLTVLCRYHHQWYTIKSRQDRKKS